jgi:hypothetical protein
MDYFSNEFYVYRVDSSSTTDMELLSLVGTSIQTLRVDDSLYFGVAEPVSVAGVTLIREPIASGGGAE